MKTKFTLLGGALLAIAGVGTATTAEAQTVSWGDGAPRMQDPDGNIQFKVRGRIMMDAVAAEQDFGATANDLDVFNTRLRRARLGVQGQFDSKWKYTAEVTLLGSGTATWEDVFLEYNTGFGSLVLGQQKVGSPLEESTSSTNIAQMERSMMIEAFGFGRVMGVGAIFGGQENWRVSAFLNGDSLNNADVLNNGTVDEQTAILVHGHWAPLYEKAKMLHLGGTVRFRDGGNDAAGTLRARARAGSNVFATRQVDVGGTNTFVEDTFYGVEAATIMGPFWASAEYGALKGDGVTAATDGDFTSYNLQAGFFLTGESRGYSAKSGTFGRTTPNAPVYEGGLGAWELRARYDYLDLDDGIIDGGEATSYTVGVNWQPAKNVRFMGEYVTTEIEERTAATNNGDVDVIQFRAQFDF